MYRISTLFLLLSVLYVSSLSAQDTRFSQFYAAPLHLNPAMVGVYDGQFRVTANYRELYSSLLNSTPFRTISTSFDMRSRLPAGDYIGFGLTALRDEAGQSHYSTTQANLALSFLKQIGGGRRSADQYLIAGAQFGGGQRGFDWSGLWFTNQFDQQTTAVDFGASSGEAFAKDNTGVYIDLSAGLMWYALFDEDMSLYLGGAMYHINTPDISLVDNQQVMLDRRYVVHAGGQLPFNRELSLVPAIAAFQQGKSTSLTAGANLRYTNSDWREVAIRLGAWVHLSNQLDDGMGMDAVAISAILEAGAMQFGLGYDITTSTLANANNGRGAWELSLIYTHPERARRRAMSCPKF